MQSENLTSEDKLRSELTELKNAGFGNLIELPVIQKMDGVSFLGILDNVYQIKVPSTRFEHTISVAYFTLKMARHLKLSDPDTNVLVVAALLHDCGHAPFSHNSEPFLLETNRLYHTGALSKILISSRGNKTEKSTEKLLIDLFGPNIIRQVISLLDGTSNSFLLSLFRSPLSCDKIEGNFRTGHYLNFQGINPLLILDTLKNLNGSIYIDANSLKIIDQFWNHEKNLYWNIIYLDEVFSSEAMLTRSLYLAFANLTNRFLYLSDEEAKAAILKTDLGSELISRIENGNYLSPLSKIDNKEFDLIEDALRESRFDLNKRRWLESNIARKFRVKKELVISHFSRRKYFTGNTQSLKQLNLFNSLNEVIPLSNVNEVLKRIKISGDYFDIFLPM